MTTYDCYLEERAVPPFLHYSTLKKEARSSTEAELPKTLFLAFTMMQLHECFGAGKLAVG